MTAANPAGIILYFAMIFLPGLGFGELVGAWKPEETLSEKFAKAFGIGLAIDAMLLFARTSGITILGFKLVGIGPGTVFAISLLGTALLFLGVARRRKLLFWSSPRRSDGFILLLMAIQLGMLSLYFQEFSIFPEFPSGDFLQYLHIAQDLAAGGTTSGTLSILYFGVHYQLASALAAIGGEPLVTVRWTMSGLAILSTPIWFLAAQKVFSRLRVSVAVVTIYTLSATVWFGTIFNAGLYSNFYGMVSTVFFLSAVTDFRSAENSFSWWSVFVVSLGNLYLSHYSSLTVLPSLLALPALGYLFRNPQLRATLASSVIPFAPALVTLPLYPGLVGSLVGIATQAGSGQLIVGSTPLADVLSGLPVVGFIATEVTDDVGAVGLFILLFVYLYYLRNTRDPRMFIAPLWFLSLVIAAPLNTTAWRFSFEALVPLTLMAGYSAGRLVPRSLSQKMQRKTGRGWTRPSIVAVILILFVPLLVGSWGQQMVQRSLTDTQGQAHIQSDVYSAIFWLRDNTPSNSTYFSVSDWRLTYTNYLIDRHTFYRFTNSPAQGIGFAQSVGANYLIVTNFVTENIPPNPQNFPWNTFPGNQPMTLIFQNSDVRVYEIS